MKHLHFYRAIALIQAERGGRAVGIKDICDVSNYSRSQVNRYFKDLLDGGLLIKPKRGKYYIARDDSSQAIGHCVNTYLDSLEYNQNQLEMLK